MMLMHNNLMKRYEKELKANMENVEVITKLNVGFSRFEFNYEVSSSACFCFS